MIEKPKSYCLNNFTVKLLLDKKNTYKNTMTLVHLILKHL
jgi:hypothetical protein